MIKKQTRWTHTEPSCSGHCWLVWCPPLSCMIPLGFPSSLFSYPSEPGCSPSLLRPVHLELVLLPCFYHGFHAATLPPQPRAYLALGYPSFLPPLVGQVPLNVIPLCTGLSHLTWPLVCEHLIEQVSKRFWKRGLLISTLGPSRENWSVFGMFSLSSMLTPPLITHRKGRNSFCVVFCLFPDLLYLAAKCICEVQS